MSKLEILKTILQQIINNIDAGNTHLDENQCVEVIEMINHMTVAEINIVSIKLVNIWELVEPHSIDM